jgi:hypothetical protein
VGDLSIDGVARSAEVKNVAYLPRGGREAFERKLTHRIDLFQIKVGDIMMYDINWWAVVHGEELIAQKLDITNMSLSVFHNRALPSDNSPIQIDNYPQQMLQKIGLPFSVPVVKVHNLDITYEEFNPDVEKSGIISFAHIDGTAENATNISQEIKRKNVANVTATCLFMGKVPLKGSFLFYLEKQRHGAFSTDIEMGQMDHSVVNPFAEPMALISMSSGTLQKAVTHVSGDDYNASGTLSAAFTDLHIQLLKKDSAAGGQGLKKKVITNFLANTFIIRKNNPGYTNKLRKPDFDLKRGDHPNFFNFLWSAIKVGLLKAIGVPPELRMTGAA